MSREYCTFGYYLSEADMISEGMQLKLFSRNMKSLTNTVLGNGYCNFDAVH